MDHELRTHLVDILPSGVSLTAIFDYSNIPNLGLHCEDYHLRSNVYIPPMTEDEYHPAGFNIRTHYVPHRSSSTQVTSAYWSDADMDLISTAHGLQVRGYGHPDFAVVGSQQRYGSEDNGAVTDWHQSAHVPRHSHGEPLQGNISLPVDDDPLAYIPRCESPSNIISGKPRGLTTSNVVRTKPVLLLSQDWTC